MKRILLIQAYQGRKEPMGAIFPLGLCYIATPLKEKNKVVIFDPNLFEDPYAELERALKDFKPEVVGLSIRNIDTLDKRDIFYYFKTVSPTLRLVKSIVPDAKVVVGGSGFSIFSKEIMERVAEIDFGIYLEGEDVMPELVDNLDSPENVKGIFYKRNGEVKFTGTRAFPRFEELPIPRRDLMDVAAYPFPMDNVGIQTKRGCPLRCSYCSYPFLNGNRVRLRTPGHVVDEIEYLIKEFGVREFMFVDGVFNVPKKHANEICREIIRRKLDVRWKAWCEIKQMDEEFLSLAEEAGCRSMPFSPDAASEEALYSLGKGITVKQIERVLCLMKRHKKIRASFGFFCTPPGQTYGGLLRTILMYLKINLLMFSRGGATMGWIRIEPHTKIQELALKEGIIDKDTNLLPKREEELKSLYYTAPSMWFGDLLVEFVLWLINKVLKPFLRLGKKILRLLKRHQTPAFGKGL